VVRPGDTLSSIAAARYGAGDLWPSLWWFNRATVKDPNVIQAGQTLNLSRWHPGRAWLDHEAAAAIARSEPAPPPPAPPSSVGGSGDTSNSSGGSVGSSPPPSSSTTVSTSGMGAFETCVIGRESGGRSQVMNASGHYGLFQFSASTWAGHGGNPADFGHASVSEQEAVFAQTYADDGTSDWQPYDGCS
jgi:hypothetical protein